MDSRQYLFTRDSLLLKGTDLYSEFLNTPTLSAGIYTLSAGASDPQKPHTEDELYYVIAGKASVQVGENKSPIREGDVVFVPAFMEHRFYEIKEELQLLVFFSKAEIRE
jgi:mannose-6-phosphate isomerase-like protein (cupin superfamily)